MKPLTVIILDGWGVNKNKKGNAISLAGVPNFNNLKRKYSYTELGASGTDVGLLKGMMGGSAVGHLNIGAGRVVMQDMLRINKTIKNGSFYNNPAVLKAIKNVKATKSTLHLMGLLSDAGVHSLDYHLYNLLKTAAKNKLKKVMIHIFTDGRDTPDNSGEKYIKRLNQQIKKYGIGEIATITGRYFAMDRDNRWNRTKRAYLALTQAKGVRAETSLAGIKAAYRKGQTDEFIDPIIIDGFQGIKDNDSIIFFNYRFDRARQITKAFVEPNFDKFKRKKLKIFFVCMTEYYKGVPAEVVTKELKLNNVLGELLSKNGLKQLRVAETEKYAHVTYFLNGMVEKPFFKEDRILIPSPKVAKYDLKPEMSAIKIAERVVKAVKSNKYQVIILNFANPDMVGHTANLGAVITAIKTVDNCIGKIITVIREKKGNAMLFGDHGNAELMIEPKTKRIHSEHTTNPVPFIIVSDKKYFLRKGKLADIAPTILEILNIKKPREMTGKSLIIKYK